MKVICNKKGICEEGLSGMCGGSIPHWECSECGNCPRDKTAKCIPYLKNDIKSTYLVGIPEDGGKV